MLCGQTVVAVQFLCVCFLFCAALVALQPFKPTASSTGL